jgi:hypothetical protein
MSINLDTITLDHGAHKTPDDGMCMMEAVSMLAGEPFGDHPTCVSPVIAEFCRSWNDALDDDARNRLLKPFARKVIGTATTEADEQVRAWMCTDWLVRTCAPAWLRKCGLGDDARALEQCEALTSADLARAAMPTIKKAQKKATVAATVARDVARAVAWDAAGDAARAVARIAAWAVAWAVAWDTVTELQQSACDLLDRMCAVGRT